MSQVTVLESEKITVWCHTADRIIHHRMHGPCYGKPFRDALSAGVEAMTKYKCRKWLSDDRLNGALSPEDEAWATTVWFPATVAAGWQYWAMVQPVKVVGQMNVARFVKLYQERGITASVFTEVEPALAWLKNPKPVQITE
jgi:hypothetical protein